MGGKQHLIREMRCKLIYRYSLDTILRIDKELK